MALMLFGLVCNVSAAPAPAAYFWEIEYIGSTDYPYWEDVFGSQTSTVQNHGGTVEATIIVVGYSSNIVLTYNGSPMSLYGVQDMDLDGDGTIDAWRYYYISSGPSGYMQLIDSGVVKDTMFVQ